MHIEQNELFRLLKVIEAIPCMQDEEETDDCFTDLRRLEAIEGEVAASDSDYHVINGKKNYYKLYGQADLDTLAGEFKRVFVVSTHADNLQKTSSFAEKRDTLNGAFDNAVTNAVCTCIMKYFKLPRNVLFAFTADEEYNAGGAKRVAKKLNRYFGEGNVDAIVLDVTSGWHDGVDFTIENDFIYEKNDGRGFIKNICDIADEAGFNWDFVKAPRDCSCKAKRDGFVSSEEIERYMGRGCKKVSQYQIWDLWEDESIVYAKKGSSAFSLCLPCSAMDTDEMHDEKGFEISKAGVCRYAEFLAKVLLGFRGLRNMSSKNENVPKILNY